MANFNGINMQNIMSAIERRKTGGSMPMTQQTTQNNMFPQAPINAIRQPSAPQGGINSIAKSNRQATSGGESEIITKALVERLNILNQGGMV